VPDARQAPPEEATTSPSPEGVDVLPSFFNSHHVEVTPAEPSVYAIPGPNNTEILYVAGGQGRDSFMAAQAFSLKHPGVEVRFSAEHIDSVTGLRTPFTGAFVTEADGSLQPIVNDPETGKAYSTFDAEQFTRRLDFVYVRP
jgi:hypothetical protein